VDAGLWFDREFMGERVPTLEEILEFSRKKRCGFLPGAKIRLGLGMDHALAAALRKSENTARTIILSFNPSMLAPLRRLDPSIMTGLLVEESGREIVKEVIEIGARQLCLRSDRVTQELVEQAHREDLQVVTWTVNDKEQMRAMISAEVEGIMTDFLTASSP